MRLKRRGWTLVGVLLAVMATAPGLWAQVATTTVQDTVYSANGSPAQGTVIVSWAAFTTAGGSSVAAGSTSAAIGANGGLTISLAPNAGATPTGSYYTAVFHLSDGTTSRQYWVIPVTAAAVKLAAIENQVLPTSMALQTVSKSYVDTAIANAVTGLPANTTGSSYVLKSGDSMTGPLVLAGDPTGAQQAADKNYVDVNVAQIAAGMSTKVSLLPTAAQRVVQPAGTGLEVNRLNGTLDATGFVTGNGGNGIANALSSPECGSGCEVTVSRGYPTGEGVGRAPSGARVVDRRGGAVSETAVDPLAPTSNSSIATSVTQVTTQTAQQAAAARPGNTGQNSYVMSLTQAAQGGGSNQFPASVESVPYNKSNYGVLQLTGNYNTQGQHVQFGNVVNCFSVGDCLAGGQFITTSGGYRDQADEGTHPFDLQVSEDSHVFQGTCANGCTAGSTTVVVNASSGTGTQGDGRFLIDKSPAKVISSGMLTGSGPNQLASFSGTNFPVSVFLSTAQAATSQAGNLAPGKVTLAIATSGVQSGYATSTAGLPGSSGVACVSDTQNGGNFPNFEMASYTAVDATHLQLTLNKVHATGATVAVGGLCGYGLEQTVDTVGQVRQLFPVIGSNSGSSLYYAGALTGVVGYSNPTNTSGYLNASLPITSVVRSGNTVTLTTAGTFPYDLNGLQMTVSGVTDGSFNGTFAVSTTGGNTLTYASAGPNSSSTGGTVGIVTGGFALYPMAEVLSVLNPAAGIDGTLTLGANTVNWAAGDPVEEPHYYQQLVGGDTEDITQFVPRPIQYQSSGKLYGGEVGPGMRGWQVTNAAPASNYLGAGGTHQPPDAAFLGAGVWRNAFEADAGQEALLRVHCNLHGCNRWDSGYALFSMDSNRGQDFLFYDPSSDTATWNLAGTNYGFSPQGFSAGTINAGTVNATTLKGTVQSTGGASSFTGPNAQYGRALHLLPNAAGQQTGIDFDNPAGVTETQVCGDASYPGQTNRWQFTMAGDYSWLLYDTSGCRSVLQVEPGGTMALMPGGSGAVTVGGSVAGALPGLLNVGAANQFFVDGSGDVSAAGMVTAKVGLASGTAANTDLVGTLVLPAGATSTAGYSFAGHYGSAPVCLVQPQSTTPAIAQGLAGYVAQVTTAGLTVSVGAAPGVSVTFGYTCVARN